MTGCTEQTARKQRIRPASPETIRKILRRDPVWSAYLLADLQPDFERFCQWFVHKTADETGLILVYTGLDMPALLTVGAPSAIAAAMNRASRLQQVYLSVREEHYPAVSRVYDLGGNKRPMLRMKLSRDTALGKKAPHIQRLNVEHSQHLTALYSHGGPFTPDAFSPYQVDNGVFYGIWDEDGQLAAAGGTHIVNRTEAVAAIGNVYTRPDRRRRGYARAITCAIVAELRDSGFETIVLNVDQRNDAARALYEELGFDVHCPYIEGIASLRPGANG